MDSKELKKILATLSIAGLLASSTLGLAGCATSGKSSCTGNKPAKETEVEKKSTGNGS